MRASAAGRRPLTVFWLLAAVTFALDQLSKGLAAHLLVAGHTRPLLGRWVGLTLAHNTGMAFGLLPSSWLWLVLGAGVCLAVLCYLTLGRVLSRHPDHAAALGLAFGGALGNLADRLRTGGVVDFIDLRIWPQFNLADIALVAAAALLARRLLKGQ